MQPYISAFEALHGLQVQVEGWPTLHPEKILTTQNALRNHNDLNQEQ